MGAQGTATLDFTAFPGTQQATIAVTGQTGILAGSLVEAWIQPATTTDHSPDEHMVEALGVVARDIVAGTGFTIYGFENRLAAHTEIVTTGQLLYGKWNIAWVWN